MRSFMLFLTAGIFEVGGGYLVWLWLREQRTVMFGVIGFVLLALYGIVPVFQSQGNPFGRIYAAYGAIFIVISMLWGWQIEGKTPDFRDWLGACICMLGATIMMWPRYRSTY